MRTAIKLSPSQVRTAVRGCVSDARADFRLGHFDRETNREQVIEWLDERCDSLWGNLVKHGRLDQYDSGDLVETAYASAVIVAVAEEDAWVEDDHGLWEGLTYGVLASIAYFSLRNLLYNAFKKAGADTNDDCPFAKWRTRKK